MPGVYSTERVLEILHKSPRVPNPPNSLRELISLSFRIKRSTRINYSLLKDYRELITAIAQTAIFMPEIKPGSFREIVDRMGIKLLRNIVFLAWLLKMESVGQYDPFDYIQLKQNWFVRAISAFLLSKAEKISSPEDVFLQAILIDLHKISLARGLPELYLQLENLPRNAFKEKEERRLLSCTMNEFAVRFFRYWGFPEKFSRIFLLLENAEQDKPKESESDRAARIIRFSIRLSDNLLQRASATPFSGIEDLSQHFFQEAPETLAGFIRTVLEKSKMFAKQYHFNELDNISFFRVIKENKELIQRQLIPYEELLDELLLSYQQIELLEREIVKIQSHESTELLKDGITDLFNHVYFQETLSKEISQSLRYEYPLSALIVDIDDFRLFNQTYGYGVGNSVLMHIGELLKKNVRQADIVARYGGDEFAIILPHTGSVQAHYIAEKLRKLIAGTNFPNPFRDMHHQLTVSIGFGTYNPQETMRTREDFIKSIYTLMQKAHQQGGNRSIGVR